VRFAAEGEVIVQMHLPCGVAPAAAALVEVTSAGPVVVQLGLGLEQQGLQSRHGMVLKSL